jgi:hypothetical protein
VNKPTFTPLPLSEVSEGGGLFGPTSFVGYIADAAFALHRASSHPPTEEQIQKMLKGDLNAGFVIALWAKFHVDEVLEPSDWDGDEFETYWSMGKSSAQNFYICDADTSKPVGMSSDRPFDELKAYAAGKYEAGGKTHIITPDKDLALFRGRWYQAQPGVPASKLKLNDKCGLIQLSKESAPAIRAVAPHLVITSLKEVKEKDGTVRNEEVYALNIWADGPDGLPLGADYFKGMEGVWDKRKVGSFTLKGEKEARDQSVLCLTTFKGYKGQGTSVSVPAGVPASAPAAPAPTPAASTPAPTATMGNADLRTRILEVMQTALPPVGQTIPRAQLAIAVLKDSGKFAADELTAASGTYTALLTSAPTKGDAEQLVMLGQEVPFYTFEPSTGAVERRV